MVKEDEREIEGTTAEVIKRHAFATGLSLSQPSTIDNPDALDETAGWKFTGIGSLPSMPGFKMVAGGLSTILLLGGALILLKRRSTAVVKTAA